MKRPSARRHSLAIGIVLVAGATLITSCGSKDNAGTATDRGPVAVRDSSASALPNYRFIDADSISAAYNLAKDFQESALKSYGSLQSAQQSHGNQIQSFANTIQERMNSNYYVGREQQFEEDQKKLAQMQRNAESALAAKQRAVEQEMTRQQVELNDSLQSFITDYNKSKGYDAIFFKAGSVYYRPELDITKEVIEGLNARYNKVDKKK